MDRPGKKIQLSIYLVFPGYPTTTNKRVLLMCLKQYLICRKQANAAHVMDAATGEAEVKAEYSNKDQIYRWRLCKESGQSELNEKIEMLV